MSIASKVTAFVGALVVALVLAAGFNMYAMNYSTSQMGQILTDTSRCETAQSAMEDEQSAFRAYILNQSEENRKTLDLATAHTLSSIERLPYDYDAIGGDRYARTWNIRNAYAAYAALRDELVENKTAEAVAVEHLYDLYDRQTYLLSYLRTLSQITVEEGAQSYNEQYSLLHSFPFIVILLSAVLLLVVASLAGVFTRSMITPITSLAHAANHVMQGDYDAPDVVVQNRDELGDMVDAFNRMKRAVESNIKTLEENQGLQERLHNEEIERVSMERQLETIRLDLLQSQINPHFLFNTLNTIAGMAEIEEAETSARMVRALSNIFRYNLHTTSQFISLTQELSVTRDYMYLQQMRFGSRLTYEVNTHDVNTDELMVPVFTLQPLVENAVTHGVARKEQGGTVTVDIAVPEGVLHIKVTDTGVGMTAGTYARMMEELRRGVHSHEVTPDEQNKTGREGRTGQDADRHLVGIGVGSLYQRIHRIYTHGEMNITSREGEGTTIEIVLPQDERVITPKNAVFTA